MNRIFSVGSLQRIADDTLLASFFNPLDDNSGLPAELAAGFSMAMGVLAPLSQSKIHVMPMVAQMTFILHGSVEIRMKDESNDEPFSLYPVPMQGVLTEAGTFVQYINHSRQPSRVLYIVSPSYIHETAADGTSSYDDAIVLDQSWRALAETGWNIGYANSFAEQREAALARRKNAAKADPATNHALRK